MAQLKEIMEIERQRTLPEDGNVIHLFQEGSFYRAYEWSAWLCVMYVNALMKVTHKPMKNSEETFCYVGFPVSSIEKYTPEGTTVEEKGEKTIDIRLVPPLMTSSSELSDLDFAEWKNTQPIATAKTKETRLEESMHFAGERKGNSARTLTGILHEILTYPVESKSPIECMLFLASVKEQIASLV